MFNSKMLTSGEPPITATCLDPFADLSGQTLYKLNGNTTDESGLTTPIATGTNWVSGKYNQGAEFAGNTSSNIYNVAYMYNNYTLSTWVKATVGGFVYSQYSSGLNWMDVGYLIGGAGETFIQVRTATQSAGSYNYKISNNLGLNTALFHHITVFYGGATNEWEVYVNGVGPIALNNQGTAGNSDLNGGGVAYIGRSRYNNKVGVYTGVVDQLRIFNRKLTPSEISYLYTSDAPCG